MAKATWRADGRLPPDTVERLEADAAAAIGRDDYMPDLTPNAHALTLEFGRFLTEREWHALMVEVRRLPYVQAVHADLVCRGGDRALSPAPPSARRRP